MEEIINLEQLEGEQRELAEVIGLESYLKLINSYAGCTIYIKKPERMIKQSRDAEIYQKFTGSNYRQLAKEYRLSELSVRKIVGNMRKNIRKFQ